MLHKHHPCVQIIRGLPGSGKSTEAKKYDCLHLELDMYCVRGRKYVWNSKQDKVAHNLLNWAIRDAMREGIDIVVAGVMPKASGTLANIVGWARDFGYEVYICTFPKKYKDVHGCSKADLDRFEAMFESDEQVWNYLKAEMPDHKFLNYHVTFGRMAYSAKVIAPEEQDEYLRRTAEIHNAFPSGRHG